MAISRYNLPAQQPIIDTYAPMPFKELLLAGTSMQKQKDDLDTKRIELAGKEFNFLDADTETAKEAQDWINTESERIAGLYGTDLRGAKQALNKFELDAKKRFGKFGDIGAMQANYDAYQNWLAQESKRLEEGDISQNQFETMNAAMLAGYGGIGQEGPLGYDKFKGTRIADYQDYTDFFDKYGKNIESDIIAAASSNPDSKGYIKDYASALEFVKPEEVQAILSKYAAGSDKLMNYLEQGLKYGYTSPEAFELGKSAAVDKYSFEKESKSASTKADSTYTWAKDKEEELLASIPQSGMTNQEYADYIGANLIDFNFDLGFGLAVDDPTNLNYLQNGMREDHTNIKKNDQKISLLKGQLKKGSLSGQAAIDSENEIKALEQANNSLKEDMEFKKANVNNIIESGLGVSSQLFNEMGITSPSGKVDYISTSLNELASLKSQKESLQAEYIDLLDMQDGFFEQNAKQSRKDYLANQIATTKSKMDKIDSEMSSIGNQMWALRGDDPDFVVKDFTAGINREASEKNYSDLVSFWTEKLDNIENSSADYNQRTTTYTTQKWTPETIEASPTMTQMQNDILADPTAFEFVEMDEDQKETALTYSTNDNPMFNGMPTNATDGVQLEIFQSVNDGSGRVAIKTINEDGVEKRMWAIPKNDTYSSTRGLENMYKYNELSASYANATSPYEQSIYANAMATIAPAIIFDSPQYTKQAEQLNDIKKNFYVGQEAASGTEMIQSYTVPTATGNKTLYITVDENDFSQYNIYDASLTTKDRIKQGYEEPYATSNDIIGTLSSITIQANQ